MIIKRFYVPFDEANATGLHSIEMPRLGRFVAIAGKNGAGKTRLLNKLFEQIMARSASIQNVEINRNNIVGLENAIRTQPNSPHIQSWLNGIASSKQQILFALERVFADEKLQFKALRFVPKKLDLMDPRQRTQSDVMSCFETAKSAQIEEYANYCFPYIQQVQNRWWNASHQHASGSDDEKSIAIDAYQNLNALIQTLLGVKLDRTRNDETSIFGKPLAASALSDGQKVILQLAVALHAQSGTLDNTVFILDELENHLHPSVAIDLLERLNQAAPNAQIWVATHSIPLLAYIFSVEPMALWYMEDGKVSHAGRHPERVLNSLLGDEFRIGQLHAFTGLPSLLAAINYAVESLLPPHVVPAEKNDPQVGQIAKILSGKVVGGSLTVLDFGAGKGRLLEGLAEANSQGSLAERINYFAFENSKVNKADCVAMIAEHFEDAEARYFDSPDGFFASKDDGAFDVVTMCNVLHEIHPNKWLPLFSSGEMILRALKDDGFLLLVEDQRIPTGEKAHEYGFLVLDTAQLKTLFKITEADIRDGLFVQDDYRSDGRLKAHLISKQLLARICAESRTQAIDQLLKASLSKIEQLRKEDATYANGQMHGFWTQQLANAYMYLNENH